MAWGEGQGPGSERSGTRIDTAVDGCSRLRSALLHSMPILAQRLPLLPHAKPVLLFVPPPQRVSHTPTAMHQQLPPLPLSCSAGCQLEQRSPASQPCAHLICAGASTGLHRVQRGTIGAGECTARWCLAMHLLPFCCRHDLPRPTQAAAHAAMSSSACSSLELAGNNIFIFTWVPPQTAGTLLNAQRAGLGGGCCAWQEGGWRASVAGHNGGQRHSAQLAWSPFILTSVTSNAPPYAGSFAAARRDEPGARLRRVGE